NLLLPHLARLKSTASYLSAATLSELHDGNLTAALEDLEALLTLARCQKDERLVISQLVRIAIAQIGAGVTWQALQTPGWTDAQLMRLDAAWRSMEFIPAMERSLEMERAMAVLTYSNARASGKEAHAIVNGYSSWGSTGSGASISSAQDLIDYITSNFPDVLRRTNRRPARNGQALCGRLGFPGGEKSVGVSLVIISPAPRGKSHLRQGPLGRAHQHSRFSVHLYS